MINKIYNKASVRPEFVLVLAVLLVSSVAAFQGVSSSYTSGTKFDFGLTSKATSSSFNSRVISGFEAVGVYDSATFTGRFGALDDITTTQAMGEIFINSTDGTNRTEQALNCFTTVIESGGRAVNFSVKWYNDDAEAVSENYYDSYANGTLFSADLDSSNTAKGENWSCSLRSFNGMIYSNWSLSGNLTIVNSPPTIILDSPGNNSYVTNSTPSFNWTGFDDDNDILIYDFNISLVPASLCVDPDQYVENLTINNFTSSDLNCYSDHGDYYLWSVRAKDNDSASDWAYLNLNHAVLVDLSFPTSSVSFGGIPYLGSNNTTDDSPLPFTIQNNGNTLVSINISAEDLWTSVSNPSSYYQLKVDSVPGEEGAFNWTVSSTNWTNAPLDDNPLIIHDLNHTDSVDSAELDIFVQVPVGELPAAKNSTITFVGSYVG